MALSEEAKEAKRKYQREWYRKHPGKAKEYQERMWEKKAKQLEEQKKDK